MNKNEFSKIRKKLDKSQKQMAQLLGVSLKAVQSFEQGWRNVPTHVERQSLLLLAKKLSDNRRTEKCWKIQNCPKDVKTSCPAWEFKFGDLCWFVNGTICHGEVQKSWEDKIKICRKCIVFKKVLPL